MYVQSGGDLSRGKIQWRLTVNRSHAFSVGGIEGSEVPRLDSRGLQSEPSHQSSQARAAQSSRRWSEEILRSFARPKIFPPLRVALPTCRPNGLLRESCPFPFVILPVRPG